MTPTVKIQKVQMLRVTGPNGCTVEMRQSGPDWNSLAELRTTKGDKLIVTAQPDSFLKLFDSIFPGISEEGAGDGVSVISGSPSLLLELGLVPNVKEKV